MKLELISFPICPFVQRSIITLLEKEAAFSTTYIDLADKPDWFLAISPEGKVPVIRVDDSEVIFESAVINEFVNEVTDGDLHPEDPVRRAHNRAWIALGENLIFDQFHMMIAEDAKQFEDKWHQAEHRLAKLEQAVRGPYFNGDTFSLVDAAYAPLLQRFAILERIVDLPDYGDFPRIRAWWEALAERASIPGSVPADFETQLRTYFREKGGYFGQKC
ncbi:glutathione S-transferase family protein [Thiohalorhabdus sp. Cl-TMA]|uniref:Glutathione S-transferase family protein n=1 Tax=Thiohalorhabdus methylotrophus TaxID=3242694 RepID=A0ABV4TR37_9GAMM